jgi:hypothetical protein
MIATYRIRTHTVTVSIGYSADRYGIFYKNSIRMKVKCGTRPAAGSPTVTTSQRWILVPDAQMAISDNSTGKHPKRRAAQRRAWQVISTRLFPNNRLDSVVVRAGSLPASKNSR